MKILFVAYYFYPEPNFFMGLPFAEGLVKLGHEVEVLTTYPNYPLGKIYDGYRNKLLYRENYGSIPVARVPLFPSHDSSAVRRIMSYTSFALTASAIGPAVVKPADVAYICQGPATIGLPGAILRFLRGIPFVYDVKDLWPDGPAATGMFNNRFGLWAAGKWCQLTYKVASKVVVCTPGYKKKLCERGVSEKKVEIIHNWCDDAQISRVNKNPQLARELGLEGKFNIVFAGNIGKAQSLDAVIDAAGILSLECPRVQFVLIGSGIEIPRLKQKTESMGLTNVLFLDRRPVSEIGAILSLADVLLVHLRDVPVYQITIPSKTQAYMAVGRPILIGVRGDAADLVTKANAGLTCEPENPRSIADAVLRFQALPQLELEKMGANGMKYYDENLSFEVALGKYIKVFESIVK
jgi:colanic acid biosynthesis glycosyl transferase WcaI